MLDNLTEDQRKVLLIWFFFGIFLIIVISLFANFKIKEKRAAEQIDDHYMVVRDYSRYYTISNILDRYYTALYNHNYDDAIKMVDNEYLTANNIDNNNFKDKIELQDIRTTFKGSLMCSKRMKDGFTSYLVSGEEVAVNKYKIFNTKYYEVLLNENNITFTIKEVDESTFGGECHA